MKKIIVNLLLVFVLVLSLTGCGSSKENDNTLTVASTLDPHSKILEFVKPILAEKGVDLEIKVLDDYFIFNKALDAGDVDANYFQHLPFFNDQIEAYGYDIVNVGGIHIEPFGFYSKTIKDIKDLKDGSTIIISNSISDHGRILSILEHEGLIEIKDGVEIVDVTLEDIASNPKNLKFIEVKPEMLNLAYDNSEGDLVAINGNYAIQAGLNPTKDAVILESADETNPYVNIVACRSEDKDDPNIKLLVDTLKSEKVKNFIEETYSNGSVIPAK